MGAQSSKRIGSADANSKCADSECRNKNNNDVEVFDHGDVSESTCVNKQMKIETPSLSASVQKIKELEKELNDLTKQMTEVECQNLDLQDRIHTLEQQLQYYEENSLPNSEIRYENFEESLHVKQHYINKLENEKETLSAEIDKLKVKLKKRVGSMKAKLAEVKSANSMEMFEMREEMSQLKEENVRLRDSTTKNSLKDLSQETLNESSSHTDENSSKMKVILDLSARVSEQDDKITELENKLSKKERYIQILEKQLIEKPSPQKNLLKTNTKPEISVRNQNIDSNHNDSSFSFQHDFEDKCEENFSTYQHHPCQPKTLQNRVKADCVPTSDVVHEDNKSMKSDIQSENIDLSTSEFSDIEVNESQQNTPISSSNLRQISALGAKHKRKKVVNSRDISGRPPVYRKQNSSNVEISEANAFLSINENVLSLSGKTSHKNPIAIT